MRFAWFIAVVAIVGCATASPPHARLVLKAGVWKYTRTITTTEPGKPPVVERQVLFLRTDPAGQSARSLFHSQFRLDEQRAMAGQHCSTGWLTDTPVRARFESLCDYQLTTNIRLRQLTWSIGVDVRVVNENKVVGIETIVRSRRGVLVDSASDVIEADWQSLDFEPCNAPECRIAPSIY